MRWKNRAWTPAALSALVALGLYAVTLGGTYVYDDLEIVYADPRLHGGTRPDMRSLIGGEDDLAQPPPVVDIQWSRYLTDSYALGSSDRLYRPATSLSYAVQWWLHGDRPWAFHLINVLLHAGASALVGELGRRIGGARVALVAGVLFAAHPVHVEAVANLVGRAELMCAIGSIGALVLMIGRRLGAWRIAGIVASFVLALLSKEQGVVAPVLLLSAWPLHRRLLDEKGVVELGQQRRAVQWLCLSLCWILAVYLVGREMYPGAERTYPLSMSWDRELLNPIINPVVLARGTDRLLVPTAILGRYMELLIFPWRLSPDYGGQIVGSTARWTDPYLYIGMACVAGGLALLGYAAMRRRPAMLLCLLGFAATYGLISNFALLIGTNMAERLMYLPSAFFIMLVVLGAIRLAERGGQGMAMALAVVGGAVLLLASVRTLRYAYAWNDRLRIAVTALAQQPRSIALHILMADELQRRGQLDEAAAAAERASQVAPDYWFVWYRRAEIAIVQGNLDEAERYLDRIVALDPRTVATHTLRQQIATRREDQSATTQEAR
jgi:hypothetical protein